MATGVQTWSQIPTNNATSDSNINWSEGMPPSQVNDSARAMMASVAKYTNDNNGSLVTSGTSSALTVNTNQVEGSYITGYTVAAQLGTAIAAAGTLAVDGLVATNIFTAMTTASLVTTGQFASGQIVEFMFSTGVGPGNGWVIKNVPGTSSFSPPVGTSVTATLTSSVSLPTSAFTDGPSVTAGSSGTWLASGTVTIFNGTANANLDLKLWDGTTPIAATQLQGPSGLNYLTASLSGVITSPAGNLRISGIIQTGSAAAGLVAQVGTVTGSTGLYSTISAVRLS